jgi:hypothetical protein
MIAFLQGAPLKRKLNPRALYALGEIRVLKRYCKLGKTHPGKNKGDAGASPKIPIALRLLDSKIVGDLKDSWNRIGSDARDILVSIAVDYTF